MTNGLEDYGGISSTAKFVNSHSAKYNHNTANWNKLFTGDPLMFMNGLKQHLSILAPQADTEEGPQKE